MGRWSAVPGRTAGAVVVLAVLVAGCEGGNVPSSSPTTPAEQTPTASPTPVTSSVPPTTSAPPAESAVVLGLGGLVNDLGFFPREDVAMAHLTERLGEPTDTAELSDCGGPGVGGRAVSWSNFVAEFSDDPPDPEAVGPVDGPAMIGWSYTLGAPGDPLALETAEGIGLQSTVAEVRTAYPNAAVEENELGETVIDVFEGDLSNLSIVTTGPLPDDTVIQIDSGALCS